MAKVIRIERIDAHGRVIVKIKKTKAPRPVNKDRGPILGGAA